MSENNPPIPPYNPWKGIIFTPSETFEQIVRKNPLTDLQFWLVFILSIILPSIESLRIAVNGISMDFLSPMGFAFLMGMLLTLCACNLVCLCIGTAILGHLAKWLGRLLEGGGTYLQMYAIITWANLPILLMSVFSLLVDILGNAQVAAFFNIEQLTKSIVLFMLVMAWTIRLVGIGYAKAHNFSLKKGIILALIAYGLPFGLAYAFILQLKR